MDCGREEKRGDPWVEPVECFETACNRQANAPWTGTRISTWGGTPDLKSAMVQGSRDPLPRGSLADGIEQDADLDFESRSKWNTRN